VWLIWLAQHTGAQHSAQHTKGDQAVFGLWSALQPARAKVDTPPPPESLNGVIDPKVIDPLVREYLNRHKASWAEHFKSFAIEDLDRDLSPEVTPAQFGSPPLGDPELKLKPDYVPPAPAFVRPASTLTDGTHPTVVGPPEGLAPLGAEYEHIKAISHLVKAVKVTLHGMKPPGDKPWGDLVILAHTNNEWQAPRDLQDGSVTFCRRTIEPGDELYLIADNHDDLMPHSGAIYTVTGEEHSPNCP
jgi:hypothetical protein